MSADTLLDWTVKGEELALAASGSWTAGNADRLEQGIEIVAQRGMRALAINLHGLEELDVFGAWLLQRLIRDAEAEDKRSNYRRAGPVSGVARQGRPDKPPRFLHRA